MGFPDLEKIMEFLLLISYFIHWVHYPNIATNCAFDMHKQERGRQGGRQAERKREREQDREQLFFFSARDCFNLPMSPCLKASWSQIFVPATPVSGITTSFNQILESSISKVKIRCSVHSKNPIIWHVISLKKKNYTVSIWVYIVWREKNN